MRLIDADKVIDTMTETLAVLKKIFPPGEQERHLIAAIDTCGEMVNDSPTIDAVPVVRCKDCKQYKTIFTWNGNEYKACELNPHGDGDWYCADGERKDDE